MTKKEKRLNYKNSFIGYMYLPVAFVVFSLLYLVLLYPDVASEGIKKGIGICLEVIIPSLFPVMLLTDYLFESGLMYRIFSKAEKLSAFIFKLPGCALPVIIMSAIGGFPVGAILTVKAFDKEQLSVSQAKRMLLFCVNPGLAFTVSTVGNSMLGSKKAGLIIYFSVTSAMLIIGILSRFFDFDGEYLINTRTDKKDIGVFQSFINSVNSTSVSIVNICKWIVTFSCINAIADILFFSENGALYFRLFSEVTGGALVAVEKYSLPVITAVVSFAGFCVHMQLMPFIYKLKLKYKYFLAVRIITAAISSFITYVFLNLFPEYCKVFFLGTKPNTVTASIPLPLCVWLMLMCGLFMIGDGYVIRKNK